MTVCDTKPVMGTQRQTRFPLANQFAERAFCEYCTTGIVRCTFPGVNVHNWGSCSTVGVGCPDIQCPDQISLSLSLPPPPTHTPGNTRMVFSIGSTCTNCTAVLTPVSAGCFMSAIPKSQAFAILEICSKVQRKQFERTIFRHCLRVAGQAHIRDMQVLVWFHKPSAVSSSQTQQQSSFGAG